MEPRTLWKGLYTVMVFGENQRDFHVEVAYTDSEQSAIIKLKGYCPDQPLSFQISLNFTQEPRVTVIPEVQAISGLTASPYSSNDDTFARHRWRRIHRL